MGEGVTKNYLKVNKSLYVNFNHGGKAFHSRSNTELGHEIKSKKLNFLTNA